MMDQTSRSHVRSPRHGEYRNAASANVNELAASPFHLPVLKQTSFAFTTKFKDCCKDGKLIENGQIETQGSVTFKIWGKEVPIPGWATPTQHRELDFRVIIITIDFELGLYASADVNLTAAGGKRTSECNPADDCGYGHVGLGITGGLNAKFELIACVESWWTSKKCAGVEIQPVAVSLTVEGGAAYHEPNCQTGLTGYAKVKDVRVSAVFKLPAVGSKGVTQTLSWDFGGFTIWDSGS